MKVLKIILITIGNLLALLGLLWFLQGIGVLPGSSMSGKIQWAINGGIAFVIGILVILATKMSGRKKDSPELYVMNTVLIAVGTLLAIIGLLWFFQGMKVLPGRSMYGKMQWAINGGISFVVGVILILGTKGIGRIGKK